MKLAALDRDILSVDENQPGKHVLYERKRRRRESRPRKAMSRVIPEDVAARAKQGFSAPDASWFRGESVDYVTGLLDRAATRA